MGPRGQAANAREVNAHDMQRGVHRCNMQRGVHRCNMQRHAPLRHRATLARPSVLSSLSALRSKADAARPSWRGPSHICAWTSWVRFGSVLRPCLFVCCVCGRWVLARVFVQLRVQLARSGSWFGCSVVCLFGRALVCARSSVPLVGLGLFVCLFVSLVWSFGVFALHGRFCGREIKDRSIHDMGVIFPAARLVRSDHSHLRASRAARTRAKGRRCARARLAHTLECCRRLLRELARDGADETASSRRRRSRAC